MARMLHLFLLAAAIAVAPESIVWKDGPPSLPAGSKIAVLEGNPKEEGIFTMRVRVPAGAALAPHWHPRDERVTILSGAVELGFGTTADRTNVTRFGAGSFYVNPPRTMHYLFFPEETVMQMTGVGPWEIHATDVSPREQSATATLRLRSITPAAGSVLDETSKINAVLEYAIEGFRPDTYFVTMHFASTTPGQTFSIVRSVPAGSAPDPLPRQKTLASAQGTETITYAMTNTWGNPKMQRPVRVRFYLHELESPATSKVIAETDWIEYR
jgi:hypothetical protein